MKDRAGSRSESGSAGSPSQRKFVDVSLEDLDPNPDQPRRRFDEGALEQLAGSISRYGLLQPILVARNEESKRFTIIAGERRVRAVRQLGWEKIRAIITAGNADEIALIENVQRKDLDPLDEAEAYLAIMDRHRYTQEDLCRIVGKAKSTVSELLSLNALPAEIRNEIRTSELESPPKSILIELAREPDSSIQREMWDLYKCGELTVKVAREKKSPKRGMREAPDRHRLARGVLDRLSRRLKALPDMTSVESRRLRRLIAGLNDFLDVLERKQSKPLPDPEGNETGEAS